MVRHVVRHAAEEEAPRPGHPLVADDDQVGLDLFGDVQEGVRDGEVELVRPFAAELLDRRGDGGVHARRRIPNACCHLKWTRILSLAVNSFFFRKPFTPLVTLRRLPKLRPGRPGAPIKILSYPGERALFAPLRAKLADKAAALR